MPIYKNFRDGSHGKDSEIIAEEGNEDGSKGYEKEEDRLSREFLQR